jgi:redox-sensitive bicupin YhaK (pirin superfamily)
LCIYRPLGRRATPFHEPVVAHVPFVMNTREEILQAFRDDQAGLFR